MVWPSAVNFLKSCWMICCGVFALMSLPARNISIANFSASTPAIAASASPAARSAGVQVGLRYISVSERIAASSSPAVCGSISTPFSWYIRYTIVEVEPSGWFRKNTGAAVTMLPSLWWSMISRISAASTPFTAWLSSL